MEGLRFEWDEHKARANLRKHGVDFLEASTAFGDPEALEAADPDHSEVEERFLLIGGTALGRLVVVAHTERGQNVRLISARRAAWRERLAYEAQQE